MGENQLQSGQPAALGGLRLDAELFRLESQFSHLGPDGAADLLSALTAARACGDAGALVRALCLVARADMFYGRIEHGIRLADECLKLAAGLDPERAVALAGVASEAWRTTGRGYFKLGNLAEAFPRLENAVSVVERVLKPQNRLDRPTASAITAVTAYPRALYDLGVAFMAVREIEESIETYARAAAAADAHPEVYRLIPDDILLALTAWAGALQLRHEATLANGGAQDSAAGDLAAARHILAGRAKMLIERAELAVAGGATPLSGYGYQSYHGALGRQLLLEGDPDAAFGEFERQMVQGLGVGNVAVAARGETGMATALLARGDAQAALPHARAALAQLNENDDASARSDAFLVISRIYAALGDTRQALDALRSQNDVGRALDAKGARLYASYLASRIGLERARAETEAQRRIAADLADFNIRLERQAAMLSAQSVELVAARRVAEAANVAKSAFLANMSHELRTPLNAILGFSELIMITSDDAQKAGYAADIRAAGSHLLAIVNDLLDLSRIEAGRMELDDDLVYIRELFAECRKLVAERAAAAGIELVELVSDGAETARCDSLRLRQILLNLLSNAIKFTPPAGIVTLAAQPGDAAIILSVSDTGCGMTADDIQIALQPFGMVDNSMSRRKQGSGLGLPLAARLAELHGGSLRIDSEPGRGTQVVVCLPQT